MLWTRSTNRIISEKAYIFGIPIPLYLVLIFFVVVLIVNGLHNWINQDNWKELVYEQYGFSISHPANWGHDTFGERGKKGVHHVKALATSFSFGPLGPSSALKMHWISMDEPTLAKAAEWGLDILPPYGGGTPYEGTLTDLQETKIGIDNYDSLTRTFRYADSPAVKVYYYIIRENGAYSIELYLKNENDMEEMQPVFNQILASFRMLDWSE